MRVRGSGRAGLGVRVCWLWGASSEEEHREFSRGPAAVFDVALTLNSVTFIVCRVSRVAFDACALSRVECVCLFIFEQAALALDYAFTGRRECAYKRVDVEFIHVRVENKKMPFELSARRAHGAHGHSGGREVTPRQIVTQRD